MYRIKTERGCGAVNSNGNNIDEEWKRLVYGTKLLWHNLMNFYSFENKSVAFLNPQANYTD
jgi:hypothetical protein